MQAPPTDSRPYFVTQGTLRSDAGCYVTRQADHELLRALIAGEFCYLLTSRQMGKSSLMAKTASRLRAQEIRAAILDLTAIGQNLTPDQWYGGLLGTLARQLELEDELEDYWDDHPEMGSLYRFMTALREVALAEGINDSSPLVVFIDEIDAVCSLPFPTDEFFAAIRECFNRRAHDPRLCRISFCLIGVASPSELIADPRMTPFNIGSRIELQDFSVAEAEPFALRLGRDPAVGRVLLERILYWTDGHPYLTQLLCAAAASSPEIKGWADLDRLCGKLLLEPGARERDDNLLFVRERLLRSRVDPASALELYSRVRSGRRVRADEAHPAMDALRLSGAVKEQDGYLVVRNRIYKRVFDSRWIAAHTRVPMRIPSEAQSGAGTGAGPEGLPHAPHSLIGRDAELRRALEALKVPGLVTLSGLGGAGKTRLAIEIGRLACSGAVDEALWVDLSAVRDGSSVAQVAAGALKVKEEPGTAVAETIRTALAGRNLLLILDNCEQVAAGCASFASSLLRPPSEIRILATSREPLHAPGETLLQVAPLPVPEAGASLETLEQSDAARLFLERAGEVRSGLPLTADSAEAVVRICRRLDGIPLALELAAARLLVLDPEQIAARLDDRFRLLTTSGSRSLPGHRTLRATLDWSYDLLEPEEARLFRRLSVFAGGWNLDAAESVTGRDQDPADLPDRLTRLIEQSLVIAESTSRGERRFRFLETVREYAREKLAESGEEDALRDAHQAHYRDLAGRIDRALEGPEAARWLELLDLETDNVRAALAWPGEPLVGLSLAAALWRYWYTRGRASEGRGWLEGILRRSGLVAPQARADALNALGNLAMLQGDLDAAGEYHGQALELREQLGDAAGVASSYNNLGIVARHRGKLREARDYYARSLERYRELRIEARVASLLANLGAIDMELDDLDSASSSLTEALRRHEQLADLSGTSAVLQNLGVVFLKMGRLDEAGHSLRRSLSLKRPLGASSRFASSMQELAILYKQQCDFDRAARLLGSLQRMYDDKLSTPAAREVDETRELAIELKRLLGVRAYEALYQTGYERLQSESLEDALQETPAA